MTAHILITSIVLVGFLFIIWKEWTLLYFFLIFLLLPLTYGGISVIAHFLFEVSDGISQTYLIGYPIIWVFTGLLIWRKKSTPLHLILWVLFGGWYILALRFSQHEPGTITPLLFDNLNLIFNWLSILLGVVPIFLILLPEVRQKYSIKRILFGFSAFITFLIFFSNF